MNITFEIEGKPQGKKRPRFSQKGTYDPKENKAYAEAIAYAFKNTAGNWIQAKYTTVDIIAYYKVPDSWSKKKKQQALKEMIPTNKPDVDNIAKAVLDSLNGIAYKDDSSVVTLTVKKRFSERNCVVVTLCNYEVSTDVQN